MSDDFDLFIIGAGPAGLAAAKRAAQSGMKVAISEQKQVGGSCVNRGCVPKKLMVYAADFAEALQQARDYAWELEPQHFHWQQFKQKRDQELQRLRQVQEQALQEAGISLLKGHSRFLDAHTLEVAGQKYTATHILIAVGGKPIRPDIPGIEQALTSDELLEIDQLPQRIAIIGGGYIGIEFASILHSFGCNVTVLDREGLILEGFDQDLQVAVQQGLMQRGIQILCGTTTDQISSTPEGITLHLTGNSSQSLRVDVVLCAIGRAPNLTELGLEAAGVQFDRKAIAVDEQSRTSQSHIYAIGDCTNRKQLTPVARTEGIAAVDTLLGRVSTQLDYNLVPSAVLSRPEAAAVGLTEAQAREKFGEAVLCHPKEFVSLKSSLVKAKHKILMKVVVDRTDDRVVGLHMVGENAAEIIQSAAVALQKQMTYTELIQAIGIHPSTAEELFSL